MQKRVWQSGNATAAGFMSRFLFHSSVWVIRGRSFFPPRVSSSWWRWGRPPAVQPRQESDTFQEQLLTVGFILSDKLWSDSRSCTENHYHQSLMISWKDRFSCFWFAFVIVICLLFQSETPTFKFKIHK